MAAATNLMEGMYWACSDAVALGAQLGLASDLPAPDVLRRRISTLFEQMEERARGAGIPPQDVGEAKYALAAFIDEQILRSQWDGRQQWMSKPLQLVYFNENTAGEGFFQHLTQLESQNKLHVVQVYYLCLTLGFQGQYAVRGGEGLGEIVDRLRVKLGKVLPRTDVISPHGELPPGGRGLARREAPIIAISLGIVGLALVLFFVLRVVVHSSADDAAQKMKNFARTAVAQ